MKHTSELIEEIRSGYVDLWTELNESTSIWFQIFQLACLIFMTIFVGPILIVVLIVATVVDIVGAIFGKKGNK